MKSISSYIFVKINVQFGDLRKVSIMRVIKKTLSLVLSLSLPSLFPSSPLHLSLSLSFMSFILSLLTYYSFSFFLSLSPPLPLLSHSPLSLPSNLLHTILYFKIILVKGLNVCDSSPKSLREKVSDNHMVLFSPT